MVFFRFGLEFFDKIFLGRSSYFIVAVQPVFGRNFKTGLFKSLLDVVGKSGIDLPGTGPAFYRVSHTGTIGCKLPGLFYRKLSV